MKRLFGKGVVAAGLLMALAGPVSAQSPSFAWWKSEQFRRDLGLAADQCARINSVFEAALPRLRQSKEELDRLEAELSSLIEANADEARVARHLDKVETTRGALNKMRTLMLLHQREVLTPEQRVRFRALHEQWDRDRRAKLLSSDSALRQPKN
jgi:Spy/CpxP family protein refolding chaperone